MGRIPDEVIEQVRDSADLLEIVQEQVALKRTGSDWRGPCPFHQGKNRNFAVFPKENRYYCFVCHAAGDVFTWFRERFGMDYPTAVREVARRYGITVPESSERHEPDPREPLFSAADAAQTWFAAQLRDNAEAEQARRYLLEREFSLDVAATLGLGYAPRGGDFQTAMRQLGISEELLIEAALLVRRDDGSVHPRFRGRLLFPIHDLRGRVVAFGGRILGQGEPKYLNSSESPIFHKGEQLYHMHVARNPIRKAGYVIVVEGYFDVLRLAIAGIEHVVAPLGTALTEAQATLIQRYTTEVVLCYDSDTPGLKATFRGGDILLAHGLRVRVATMPPGEDPDTLAQRGGAAAVEAVLADAVDILERKLQLLEVKGWFGDVRRAREALDRLLPTVRAAHDPVTRELYVTRVAERLGIPRDTVSQEAARSPAPAAATPVAVRPAVRDRRAVMPSRSARIPGTEIERKLLRLMLLSPEWLARGVDEVDPALFAVPSHRAIFQAATSLPTGAPPGDALAGLDERSREVWMRLVEDGGPGAGFDFDREYVGAIAALEERRTFAEIAAEADPSVRRRRRNALSAEGATRFTYYLKAVANERDAPPAEE